MEINEFERRRIYLSGVEDALQELLGIYGDNLPTIVRNNYEDTLKQIAELNRQL